MRVFGTSFKLAALYLKPRHLHYTPGPSSREFRFPSATHMKGKQVVHQADILILVRRDDRLHSALFSVG